MKRYVYELPRRIWLSSSGPSQCCCEKHSVDVRATEKKYHRKTQWSIRLLTECGVVCVCVCVCVWLLTDRPTALRKHGTAFWHDRLCDNIKREKAAVSDPISPQTLERLPLPQKNKTRQRRTASKSDFCTREPVCLPLRLALTREAA